MNGKAAEKLLNPELYQVFLMRCPASIPLNFAAHPWFVTNKKGVVARWEVTWRRAFDSADTWGHLRRNMFPPFQGVRVLYFWDAFHWKAKLLRAIEGGESSIAARMIECIENSPKTYPYKDTYSFVGPNSNTYAQWVLDQFPETELKLPWNAFGKSR